MLGYSCYERWACGGKLLVSRAGSVFNGTGEIVGEGVHEQVRRLVYSFVEFVKASS